MDVFQFRDRLIGDYASYISSFIQIRDERIRQHVDHSLNDGLLWPEPLIQQQAQVAAAGSILFGAAIQPEHVIGETLCRAAPEKKIDDPSFIKELFRRVADEQRKPPPKYSSFVQDPLSVWIESTFGITSEPGGARLIRSKPRPISGDDGASRDLSRLTGIQENRCAQAIQEALLAGYWNDTMDYVNLGIAVTGSETRPV
jgi:hypothetical protein